MKFNEFLIENNTYRGDVNEIMLAYYLAGSWSKITDSDEVKTALKNRKDQLTQEEADEESRRAQAMSKEIQAWMADNNYSDISSVSWIGRGTNDQLAKVLPNLKGSTPADILINFKDGSTLGISAKSTSYGRETVYRSIGLGQLDTTLKTELNKIKSRAEDRFINQYNLANEPIKRKDQIRGNPIINKTANEQRFVVLRNIRNKLFSKMQMLPKEKLAAFVVGFLMGKDIHDSKLPYIQVTGHGSGKVTITDPKKDVKLKAIKTAKKIIMDKSGNDSITVKADDINIVRIRIKYGTVPLASPIEISVDPWNVKQKG